MDRRNFLKATSVGALGVSGTVAISDTDVTQLIPTPDEIEGPFYPVVAQKDKDFDLTHIQGREQTALGHHIVVDGQVVDTKGRAVEDATVDLWQANAAGRYWHPRDPNPALIDENFQGWAIVSSGKEGGFRFKTVMPGAYPASGSWVRPPHIHFKVSKTGYKELITQMYFPDQPLNDLDLLLQRKSPGEQMLMIADKSSKHSEKYYYKIVLQQI